MTEKNVSNQSGKTRVAMIGLGGSAERIILPALSTLPNVEVVAACDVNTSACDAASKKWAIPNVYTDPAEMLGKEKPDVAVIATPPLTHPDLSLLALENGCDVYCEKPFMPSVEDADRVIARAAQTGRTIAVNNQYSQMPMFRKISDLVNSGEHGRLYNISVWQQLYQIPDDEGGWKAALQPRRVLYEFGTHVLDLICHFFGSYPTSVACRIPHVREGVNADVFVSLRLDFPGDRIANVNINRVSHAPKKYIEMRLDFEEASVRASVGGVARMDFGWNSELGRPRLRFGLAKGGEVRVERDGKSKQIISQSEKALYTASADNISQFLSSVQGGMEPMLSAGHAREVLRIVFAGYDSAEQGGRLIELSEADSKQKYLSVAHS